MALIEILALPSSNTIDVGCHLAAWSSRLSKVSKTVFAFEPNAFLVDNIHRARIRNLVLYETALSDKAGVSQLGLPILDGMVRFGNASLDVSI